MQQDRIYILQIMRKPTARAGFHLDSIFLETFLHTLRFTLRALPVILWLALGLVLVTVFFPLVSIRLRGTLTQAWSRVLMAFCGVRIRVAGTPVLRTPVLWVANHVSWIDIFCLNRVRSTVFVAKRDIRQWPMIGWLVAGAGTIFIERGSRQALRHVGAAIEQRLHQGAAVGLFPEGTTSSGVDVLPFHASLFEAAIRAQPDVQAVALRFYHRGQRSAHAAFTGEQTLVANLWQLLGAGATHVELEFLAPYPAAQCQELGRHGLAVATHEVIRAAVVEHAQNVSTKESTQGLQCGDRT